jgi:hypothetical protein
MSEPIRTCRECGKQALNDIDLQTFVISHRSKIGRVNLCKDCFNKIRREQRKNPDIKWHGKIHQPKIKLIDLSNTNETELAYWAGAIDSDGNIGLYGQRRRKIKKIYPNTHTYYQLLIGFTNISEKLVLDFRKLVGEKGCYSSDNRSSNIVYNYFYSGTRAYSLLKALVPYLRLKKKQALLGIEYWDNKKMGRGKRLDNEEINKRENYYNEMKKLNSCGGKLAEW